MIGPRPPVSFDQARALVRSVASRVAPERLRLADAVGWPCAEAIIAPCDYPRFDTSAMDGFAVIAESTLSAAKDSPTWLDLEGPSPTAAPIATGAVVASPYDAVVAIEHCRLERMPAQLGVGQPLRTGHNVRPKGEDGRQGDVLIDRRTILDPGKIAALANFGVANALVRRPPSVGVLVTGDEIVDGDPGAHGVFDANGPMIEAHCRALRVPLAGLARADDRAPDIAARVAELRQAGAEIIVTTGGTSVGRRDRLHEAVVELGGEVVFHGVRMRPGKPVLCARIGDQALLFGLPGPPTSALVAFRFLVIAALQTALDLPDEAGEEIAPWANDRDGDSADILPGAIERRGDVTTFLRSPDHRPQRVKALLDGSAWRVDDRNSSGAPRSRLFAWEPQWTDL